MWRNFEKISRVVAGWHPLWSKAAPASATSMRRGLENLKILRVPRGSVRAKMRWARWRRRSVALQNGAWEPIRLGKFRLLSVGLANGGGGACRE